MATRRGKPLSDWALLRNFVLARDRGCVAHGLDVRCFGPLDPHHLWRRGQGGPDEAENLVTLARTCHSYVHAHPLVGQCLGLLVPAWTGMAGVAVTPELRQRARYRTPMFAPWLTATERADVWAQLPAVMDTPPLTTPFHPPVYGTG